MTKIAELYEELIDHHASLLLAHGAYQAAERAMLESEVGLAYLQAEKELGIAKVGKAEADRAVRQCAIKIYVATEEKRPHRHVSVRIRTTLEYDPGRALGWAIKRQPDFVIPAQVDKKRFEKYARAVREVAPLDFVEFEEIPSVAISLDRDS